MMRTFFLLLISVSVFGQQHVPDTTQKLSLTLTEKQWGNVFNVLRTSGKVPAGDVEDMISGLSKMMKPADLPKVDSTGKKK